MRLTVPAGAEPRGEDPGRIAGGGGRGMHSGIVPLSGDRGHVAEVAPQLLDALTARHVRPIRLAVAGEQTETQEEVRPNDRVSLCAEPKGICSSTNSCLSVIE